MEAILLCYILTPLIYYAVKVGPRSPMRCCILILVALCCINAPVYLLRHRFDIPDASILLHPPFGYRRIVFAHVAVFAAGMVLRRQSNHTPSRTPTSAVQVTGAMTLLTLTIAAWTGCHMLDGSRAQALSRILDVIMLCTAVMTCGCFARWRGRIPVIHLLGHHAYPIYLFHLVYYGAVIHLTPAALARHTVWVTIGLFPCFVFGCALLEDLSRKLLGRRSGIARPS